MPNPNEALLLTEAPPLASFTALAELSRSCLCCLCFIDDDPAPNNDLDDAVTASFPMARKELELLVVPDVVVEFFLLIELNTSPAETFLPLTPFPCTSSGTAQRSSPSPEPCDTFRAPGPEGTFSPGYTRVAVDMSWALVARVSALW